MEREKNRIADIIIHPNSHVWSAACVGKKNFLRLANVEYSHLIGLIYQGIYSNLKCWQMFSSQPIYAEEIPIPKRYLNGKQAGQL